VVLTVPSCGTHLGGHEEGGAQAPARPVFAVGILTAYPQQTVSRWGLTAQQAGPGPAPHL